MSLTLLQQCILEEEKLQFDHFSHQDAFDLGMKLIKYGSMQAAPVAIEIALNDLIVFRYYLDGTNLYNEMWLRWKRNMVYTRQMSSLNAFAEMEEKGETLEDWRLDPKDYAAFGGGFPIRIKGSSVVGFIGVSGLPHLKDHEVIISALKDYLNVTL